MKQSPLVWDGVLSRLATELPEFALEAWVRPLAVHTEGDRLHLLAPNLFHRERVRQHFLTSIRACARAEAGPSLEVSLEIADEAPPIAPAAGKPGRSRPSSSAAALPPPGAGAEAGAQRPQVAAVCPAHRQLPLPRSFASFVVGPANALAREAALAVAQGRQLGVSALFLAGPCGTGKSHLAHALVNEARERGVVRTIYTSAEKFTNEFLASIRSRQTAGVKRRFREQCDLLVFEDVQFLEGKATTQLELFHTFEHLANVGSRVVLTGDRLPRAIPKLDPRLASQMSSGLVAELELPDRELRLAIVREKAARGGLRVPKDCMMRLVDGVEGSIRDLEGALVQLVASASLLNRRIDPELTESALRKVAESKPQGVTVDFVIETVTSFFGIGSREIASRSRKRSVLVPRQLAMYLCRRYTNASLAEIGRALGRDHPAVSNAVEVIERSILERAPLRYQVEALVGRLERRRSSGGKGRTER